MDYKGELIKIGSTDVESILAINKRLNELHYQLDVNSTVFDKNKAVLIEQFQELNQLAEDGVVGRLTWTRLFNPRANSPVESKILRLRALEIMNTQLRVRELTGKNDGKEVESYLKDVGLSKGYPWCQSLVYWSFDNASRQLNIPNPMPKTGGVLDHLARVKASGKAKIITSNPEQGDIFIMDFGAGHGHTGMVEAQPESLVFTIEGNTSADPQTAANDRDGQGVYERSRVKSSIKCYIRYE